MAINTRKQQAFTIVELLIVIVVIGILAAITIVAYNGIQARANDSKINAAAAQIEKAIRLYAIDNGPAIKGGSGSTAVAAGQPCVDGANGWFGGVYLCPVENTLAANKLLPSGLTIGLPPNTYYSGGTPSNGRLTVMFYGCGTDRFVLYWYLQNPSSDDTTTFNAAMSTCGHAAASFRDSYGMRAGRLIQL